MFLLCQLVIQRFLIETVLWKILSFSSSFSKLTQIIIFILCDKCNIHLCTTALYKSVRHPKLTTNFVRSLEEHRWQGEENINC